MLDYLLKQSAPAGCFPISVVVVELGGRFLNFCQGDLTNAPGPGARLQFVGDELPRFGGVALWFHAAPLQRGSHKRKCICFKFEHMGIFPHSIDPVN